MRFDSLPDRTRALFKTAAGSDQLEPFTLIGGTALALQLGHRISMDLDFAVFTEHLPTGAVRSWIDYLRTRGVVANSVADPQKASAFRINAGMPLSDFVQDYEIAGVKTTFFAHGKNAAQRDFYRNAAKITDGSRSFSILGLEGLKVAKTLVLADRVRSRDLFDVMKLVERCDLGIDDMVRIVKELGHNNDPEYYFSVMSGEIPLDDDDEGLQPTGTKVEIDTVYDYLIECMDEWQIAQAEREYRSGE